MSWRIPNPHGGRAKRKAQAFATADARDTAAQALAQKREAYATAAQDFDPIKWVRFRQAEQAAGGRDLLLIVEEWKKYAAIVHGGQIKPARTVRTAVEDYLRLRYARKLSPDTKRHFEKHLRERFVGRFGNMDLAAITPQHIEQWLDTLPFENLTKRHHRKDVNTFFKRAVDLEWCSKNPCAAVPPPDVEEKDTTVLPLEQARSLFAANATNPILPRLALEAFGGLRYTSAGRVRKEHINYDDRGIAMPGAIHKSQKRKFRQGQPDNLWAFLALATDATWDMPLWKYRNEKAKAFARAGIDDPPPNILRHSFVSYHLAWLRNFSLTQYLAQHANIQTTMIYEGVAKHADGIAYFQIMPTRRAPRGQKAKPDTCATASRSRRLPRTGSAAET